jgi:hypothetical protein
VKKVSLLLLSLLLISNLLPAQIELIGLWLDGSQSNVTALRWDAQTGNVLDSVQTAENSVYMGSSTFNPTTGSYYFRSTTGLQQIDFNPDTTASLGQIGLSSSTEIDMANGQIYEVQPIGNYDTLGNLVSQELQLLRYNLATGTDSVIGVVPNVWGVVLDASTFNSNTGEYYVVGVDNAGNYGIIRMTTRGAFSYTQVPIATNAVIFMGLEYDNEYNILYGLSYNSLPVGNMFDLYQIDVLTGALTLERGLPEIVGIPITTETFDQTTSSFVIMGIDSLGAYNLYIYRTVQNTLSIGGVPRLYPTEIEADNSLFAFSKYGSVTARPAPAASGTRIYPNPVADALRIANTDALAGYEIHDLSGRIVARGGSTRQIMVADLVPGLYVLRGSLQDGQTFQEKFIKQ